MSEVERRCEYTAVALSVLSEGQRLFALECFGEPE